MAALTTTALPLAAQGSAASTDSITLDALASWIALHAQPGYEQQATDIISRSLPGWQRDALGNLVLRRGEGRPRRVVACGLDEAGYAVSAITDDGYLRLHGAGNARRGALWDQFHEGQRILVVTRAGIIPGVTAVRSVHLWRGRVAAETPTTIEDLWVDVGARTRAEAQSLGVTLLDPVVRDWPRWTYGGRVAGPAAADRAGCAAVAAAARSAPEKGETVYVISAQSAFGWDGLSAAMSQLGEVDTLVIASARLTAGDSGYSDAPVIRRSVRTPFAPVPRLTIGTTIALAVRSSFTGTLVESVRADAAAQYAEAVAEAAGVRVHAKVALILPPLSIAQSSADKRPATERDSLAVTSGLLSTLTETYGLSGHEAAVREAVRAALPAWAQSRVSTDSAGNLVLALGPERDTAVFVAHMDEVGFDVAQIARDGTVSLRRRGGFLTSLWEGQPALLHLENGRGLAALRGIFVPRDSASTSQPREMTAWFGVDSAALAARGVTVGAAVTGHKTAARLGQSRFTARSIDDRAGCTALIEAVRSLRPEALTHKVIFVWSVREEIGLEGAVAVASAVRGTPTRVYAVDTFVSSDSPLESPRFADTPIGDGPVVRALDNSSATSPAEVDRVLSLAKRDGIPIQVGTTNGGNDGSAFVGYGVRDIPISWPLRYSHSPAEVIDLVDVAALGRLVAALATY